MRAAGQSLTEYRHYALHGFLLSMAFAAIVTTVAGRVTEITPSVSGSQTQPVAETSAGYMKPPVLISTVPSVLARHQAEVQATAVTPLGTPAPDTPAPTDAAAPEPQPAFFTYTVQPGDTVSSIAESFGIAYDYIIWNNQGVAANPDMLVVGATVLVPSTAIASSRSSVSVSRIRSR